MKIELRIKFRVDLRFTKIDLYKFEKTIDLLIGPEPVLILPKFEKVLVDERGVYLKVSA